LEKNSGETQRRHVAEKHSGGTHGETLWRNTAEKHNVDTQRRNIVEKHGETQSAYDARKQENLIISEVVRDG